SADPRVERHELAPDAPIELARDSADNVYLRARRSVDGATRHLGWWSDAPRGYFGGALPHGKRLSDEPRELLRDLQPPTRARAERVIRTIGIDRTRPLDEVLSKLVAWFRGFEVGALPSNLGSTYLDIALSRRGACRHRAYAFTITALALGIPARYVENELHAF